MNKTLLAVGIAMMWPLIVAGQASAATLIVPSGNANTSSQNNSNSPFGNNSSAGFTLQLDYAASQLSKVADGSLITGIGFRLFSNSGTINQALNYTSFNIQVGTSANTIAGLSRTFSANLGADTIVARSGAMTIASGALVGNKRINPFYTINFLTPYVYHSGDLLVTIRDGLAVDTQNVYVSLDAVSTSSLIGDVGTSSGSGTTGFANFFYAPVTQLTFSAPVATVAEPASWAMMIGGFGLVGTAMRRRSLRTLSGNA